MLPYLVGREAQDRGNPTNQRVNNVIQSRLRRSSCLAISLGGVLAIFNDIQVKTTQLYRAKVMYFLIDQVELISIECRCDFTL